MSWMLFLLRPFSLLYGFAMHIRNILFDRGILPSQSYSFPVIGIGNLSMGGSGKTPHAEYLCRLLFTRRNIAILSRGYKRNTTGYRIVEIDSTAAEVGDEPAQIKRKFPEVLVAVHESRKKGIERIIADHPRINTILLDDAFQHRYVKPGLNLLLTEYNNPYFRNRGFPAGNLRELQTGAKRADAVIVSKSPCIISDSERTAFVQNLKYHTPENVYFSCLEYAKPTPLWGEESQTESSFFYETILLVSAIANSSAMEHYLQNHCKDLISITFRDHHAFRSADLKKIRELFLAVNSVSKAIFTTEKDAIRLPSKVADHILGDLPVFCLPVSVRFLAQDRERFEGMIQNFIDQYQT